MKSEKRIVNNCGVPHGGTDFERRQGTGCTAPAGSNSLAPPVSQVSMPEPRFPSTEPTQVDSPLHFPEKQKHPGFTGVPFLQSFPRQSRRGGRPDGICCRSSVGVNRRVSKRQRRNPPPHRGQSPLWKNAVTPAMPSTSPLHRILGGEAFVGGTFGSLPHLSEAPASGFPAALPGK